MIKFIGWLSIVSSVIPLSIFTMVVFGCHPFGVIVNILGIDETVNFTDNGKEKLAYIIISSFSFLFLSILGFTIIRNSKEFIADIEKRI